jgi:putative MATE family efflux protein
MAIDMSEHLSLSMLLKYTAPSIAMVVFTSLYSIVDGLFISNFAGDTAFAAVNIIMPYIMLLSATGFMIGTGGAALISKTRGEGDELQANRYFSMLVIFTAILGVILTAFGEITTPFVSAMLGASGEVLECATLYGNIVFASLTFFTLQMAFQSFFVAAGRPTLGFVVIVIAGATNMILDALFVGVFGWSLIGAAIATNISEFLGGIIPVIYFINKNNKSHLHLSLARIEWRIVRKSCLNGLSEMVSNVSVSIVSMIYNYQLMWHIGVYGVAAYGVIMYTIMIFTGIFHGYSIGAGSLLSYQYGARHVTEMRSIMFKSLGVIGGACLIMFLLAQVFAGVVSSIFVGYNPDLLNLTTRAYKIFAISFLFMGFPIYGASFFTALGNGGVSAAIAGLRTGVFESCCAILIPHLFGINAIWYSVTVAEVLAAALTAILMYAYGKRYGYRKKPKTIALN